MHGLFERVADFETMFGRGCAGNGPEVMGALCGWDDLLSEDCDWAQVMLATAQRGNHGATLGGKNALMILHGIGAKRFQ